MLCRNPKSSPTTKLLCSSATWSGREAIDPSATGFRRGELIPGRRKQTSPDSETHAGRNHTNERETTSPGLCLVHAKWSRVRQWRGWTLHIETGRGRRGGDQLLHTGSNQGREESYVCTDVGQTRCFRNHFVLIGFRPQLHGGDENGGGCSETTIKEGQEGSFSPKQ